MKVKKVIIPVAGFGTRFLPYTKAIPKEMLPIVDKPVIQYVVEEAVSAGIEDVILVTGANKRAIEDHFDFSYELEKRLADFGKYQLIADIQKPAELANFIHIRQKGAYGNAIPVKISQHLVGNEPFLVLWGDEFFVCKGKSRAEQAVEAYEKYEATIICGIMTDDPEDTKKYAFVDGKEVEPGVWKVNRLLEKPGPSKAPSNLAILSGDILTPDIFPILHNQKPGYGGEYTLHEAVGELAESGKPVYAITIDYEKYYDTGNKFSYMKAVTEMSLRNKEYGEEYKNYLKELLSSLD
jgi:UTP--glucose-1-phosphate uridylyltransferase